MAAMEAVGVSSGAIERFVQTLQQQFPETYKEMTTQEACTSIVVPRTKDSQCAYIDVMREENKDNVGRATVFVSHAWRYKIVDVLTTLLEFAAEEGQSGSSKTQHVNVTANLPQDWWSTTFKKSIRQIGKVLLVLTPWNDPVPLTRAWCLWEIFCSISQADVDLQIRLPSQQRHALRDAITETHTAVTNMLVEVQAEKAEAWKKEDKDMIFRAIQSTVGFTALNRAVKDRMRAWCLRTVDAFVTAHQQQREDANRDDTWAAAKFAQLCHQTGMVMVTFGELDRGIMHLTKALDVVSGLKDQQLLASTIHTSLGNAYNSKGAFDRALEHHSIVLQLRRELLPARDPRIAAAHNNLANASANKGNNASAIDHFTQALDIQLAAVGERDPNTAAMYNDLGNVYNNCRDYARAIACLNKALGTRIALLGEHHPETAVTLNNIGRSFGEMGEHGKAAGYFQLALECFLTVLGPNHSRTQQAAHNAAMSRQMALAHGMPVTPVTIPTAAHAPTSTAKRTGTSSHNSNTQAQSLLVRFLAAVSPPTPQQQLLVRFLAKTLSTRASQDPGADPGPTSRFHEAAKHQQEHSDDSPGDEEDQHVPVRKGCCGMQ
ncbi:hypothetical protein PTSG_11051 [Salpingoeca rosetta]|uniref:Uncharacterized protein n=1 Tax=Salpingoeca rosetta (strain ATCC 50818 / BSB-021) TaxID=946362 RepID=F2US01_SALR5|nr:uncharacterized protein PTSG_11051 [Salpingoeca rosetta]EGD80406.1 hypothetical protein PTSG_11051 [Salpingoeca rosetta]|eukprot:XP_004987970.1 hypothetical protein PTSG_11051 [Salpingoeca rosetta]